MKNMKKSNMKLYKAIMENINNSYALKHLNESFDDELTELWDNLLAYEIATEEELKLVTSINGYNAESLLDILYVRTGYRSWDQYYDAELR